MIELIVVCAIISIIVGVVLLNFRGFQTKDTLDIAARTLTSDLRWSQNAAMSGLTQGTDTVYGYGIYIESNNNYRVFYNKAKGDGEKYISGTSKPIRNITLPNKITVKSGVSTHIFFIPPDPTTKISVGSGTVTLTDGTNDKSVIIDTAGLISY